MQDQLEEEWWDVENVFTAVLATVESAQAADLKPLAERRQLLQKDANAFNDTLEDEINKLEKTISELDDIALLEDHILFLEVRGNV